MIHQKRISYLFLLFFIKTSYSLNNQIASHLQLQSKTPEAPYIKQFYMISDQYGTTGSLIILKIASSTNEQIEWMKLPVNVLYDQKSKLEQEVIAIGKINYSSQITMQKLEDEYSALHPWEKLIKGKKIKNEIEALQQSHQRLLDRIENIMETMQIINQAIGFHQTHTFEIYYPSSYNNRVEIIHIMPLRQELIILKESPSFQIITSYQEKESKPSLHNNKEYQQAKEALFNQLRDLYRKTKFYAARAQELNLVEKTEFDLIQEEISYLGKNLI